MLFLPLRGALAGGQTGGWHWRNRRRAPGVPLPAIGRRARLGMLCTNGDWRMTPVGLRSDGEDSRRGGALFHQRQGGHDEGGTDHRPAYGNAHQGEYAQLHGCAVRDEGRSGLPERPPTRGIELLGKLFEFQVSSRRYRFTVH